MITSLSSFNPQEDAVDASPEFQQIQRFALRPATERLLGELLNAPKHFLSKEDVRQDVLYDDDASDPSIRACISKARKDLKRSALPYRIMTVYSKGFLLLRCPNGG